MTSDAMAIEIVDHAAPLTPQQARDAMETYQEISKALINPGEDLQTIHTKTGPRTFPKRSALQKIANAYRVSTQIVSREVERGGDGQILRCSVVVRAIHPDGRFSEGDGVCSRDEERFATSGDKIEHDLPATAVTRATNRAISNLVAFGAVSAEEVEADVGNEPPAWAEHIGPNDIKSFGDDLHSLLKAAAGDAAAKGFTEIGQAIFDGCDGGVPRCVAHVVRVLTERAGEAPQQAENATTTSQEDQK